MDRKNDKWLPLAICAAAALSFELTPLDAVMRALLVSALCLTAACHEPCCVDRFGPLPGLDPLLLADSAAVGSTTPRITSITIVNNGGGAVGWSVVVQHSSPWITVSPASGTVGVTPQPQVSLDPTGLVEGTYRDTLVFVVGEDIKVPVEFRIHP